MRYIILMQPVIHAFYSNKQEMRTSGAPDVVEGSRDLRSGLTGPVVKAPCFGASSCEFSKSLSDACYLLPVRA